MSRLGLIGDVHCEHESLAIAIETLQACHCETIVCTGDIPTGPGNVNACCELLKRNRIPTIRGNHDRWLIDLFPNTSPFATPPSALTKASWRFLESLPETIDLPTPAGLALLCHGLGREDMLSIRPEQTDLDEHPVLNAILNSRQYRWIFNGHSHHRMVRRYGSVVIVNAGTLRRDHNPCFAAVDFDQEQVLFWDIPNQTTVVPAATVSCAS